MQYVILIWINLIVLGGFFVGCYSPERSLSLDPHNKPLIHILESTYDFSSGTVRVRWEYIGQEPVTVFEIQRRILDAFETVATVNGTTENPKYVFVSAYEDEALVSGESVFYQVIAKLAGGGQEITQTSSVIIPGAQAVGVVRDPVRLQVQFRWQPDPLVGVGYQVLRTNGNGASQIVFETQDANASVYLDENIENNKPYHYTVITLTQSGKALTSRPLTAHFYNEATTQPVETVRIETERLRLAVGEPTTSGGTLALVSRVNQLSLYQFRYQIGLAFDGSPRILRTLEGIVFPDVIDYLPQSVDLAGPLDLPSNAIFPRIYIGGILSNGQIEIVGYEMPVFNRVWSMPTSWNLPAGATQVSLARDNTSNLFACVGNELRVFSDFGEPKGNEILDETVKDITVQGDQIWILYANGQIVYGTLVFEQGLLSQINWAMRPINVSKAVALTHNSFGQVCVLDAGDRQVKIYNADGQLLIQFGLPIGEYEAGDLVVDQAARNLVQVTDGRGDIVTFIP